MILANTHKAITKDYSVPGFVLGLIHMSIYDV